MKTAPMAHLALNVSDTDMDFSVGMPINSFGRTLIRWLGAVKQPINFPASMFTEFIGN